MLGRAVGFSSVSGTPGAPLTPWHPQAALVQRVSWVRAAPGGVAPIPLSTPAGR